MESLEISATDLDLISCEDEHVIYSVDNAFLLSEMIRIITGRSMYRIRLSFD